MKRLILNILFLTFLFSGCRKYSRLDGYYFYCVEGYYGEVYFKQDSWRIASEDEWTGLSNWKKMTVKNDTLFFESFGEWRTNIEAKITYIDNDNKHLQLTFGDNTYELEHLQGKLNLKDSMAFWEGFEKRRDARRCK